MEDETDDEAMARLTRAMEEFAMSFYELGIKAQAAALAMMLKSYREPFFSEDVSLSENELLELPSMRPHWNVRAHNRNPN